MLAWKILIKILARVVKSYNQGFWRRGLNSLKCHGCYENYCFWAAGLKVLSSGGSSCSTYIPCPWDTRFSAFHFAAVLWSGRKNWSRSSFFSDHFRYALLQLSFPCLLLWLKKCFFPPFGLEVKLKRVKYAARPVGLHHALALSSSVEPQGFFSFILPQEVIGSCWSSCCFALLLPHQCFLDNCGSSDTPMGIGLQFSCLAKWLQWLFLDHVKTSEPPAFQVVSQGTVSGCLQDTP